MGVVNDLTSYVAGSVTGDRRWGTRAVLRQPESPGVLDSTSSRGPGAGNQEGEPGQRSRQGVPAECPWPCMLPHTSSPTNSPLPTTPCIQSIPFFGVSANIFSHVALVVKIARTILTNCVI